MLQANSRRVKALGIATIVKKEQLRIQRGLKREQDWPPANDAMQTQETNLVAEWPTVRLREGGLDLCTKETAALYTDVKSVRIATHAFSKPALSFETKGG